MVPKFRAYIRHIDKVVDVFELHLTKELSVLDISIDEVYPELGYWWKETNVPFSEIKLLQSTGLTDKNGKEIFTGDIIDMDYLECGVIGELSRLKMELFMLNTQELKLMTNCCIRLTERLQSSGIFMRTKICKVW